MRLLKLKINRKALEKMYIAFTCIRPLLEYSDSVWENSPAHVKKQLDDIHYKAARIITGGTKLCSHDKLLSDLWWDSLQERRTKHKLVIFYKILYNLTPPYLQDFVPPLVQEANPYRLRNSNDIHTIHANTDLFNNSFFIPSPYETGITYPKKLKSSSVASFKYQLNKDTQRRAPPKFFFAWSRLGQILHAKIQMACSLWPSCACGGLKVRTTFSSYAQITM